MYSIACLNIWTIHNLLYKQRLLKFYTFWRKHKESARQTTNTWNAPVCQSILATHLFCNAKLVDGHNNMTKMIETTVMYHQVLLLDIVVVIPVDLLCGNQMALYENEHSTGAPTFWFLDFWSSLQTFAYQELSRNLSAQTGKDVYAVYNLLGKQNCCPNITILHCSME